MAKHDGSRTIAIFALGTRGDVQPYLALSLALAARDHAVTLAAPDDFRDWIEGRGVAFAPMGTDFQALMQEPDMQHALRGNPMRFRKLWREVAVPMLKASLATLWEVGQGADVLVHHPKVVGAADVAQVTGAPVVCASPVPMTSTSAFPLLTMTRSLGGPLNRLSWLPLRLARPFYARPLGDWREQVLGLPRRFTRRPGTDAATGADLRLVAVSEHLLPRPADWDARTHLTGYWFLEDRDAALDPGLEEFLSAGPPPVYIGFGSMPSDDPAALTGEIVEAVGRAGLRAVLAGGWAGIGGGEMPEAIHAIDSAPHSALFPRVSAVVHHGGAGTVAAGLRAGRPTLVCPFGVDQPFWAKRVHARGCGPVPLPAEKITAATLAGRLSDLVATPIYAEAARQVAQGIAAEDGLGKAVALIEGAAPVTG